MPRRSRCRESLSRRLAFRELKTLHWVFCEGATEEVCLNNLRIHRRLSNLHVTVAGQVGTPWTVVQRAVDKRIELTRRKVSRFFIHVVFDRDEHPRFEEAIQRARACGFTLGVSVPCFELWGILLHQDQTAFITRSDAQRLLKGLHPGYDHARHPYLDLDTVLNHLEDASRRSEVLRQRARDAGDEFQNPSTCFRDVLSVIFT